MTEQRITSRKNPLLQQVKKLLSSRKAREEAGLFAADGVKLLAEAVRWYPGLDTVILSDGVHADVPESVRLFRVPEDVMASISPMESPQGALFLCRLPERKAYVPQPGCLLLDGIQDPGNLGTILRTADALDIPVTLLEGCADPYSPKTVRASMGAVFRTQPVKADWAEVKAACAGCRNSRGCDGTEPAGEGFAECRPSRHGGGHWQRRAGRAPGNSGKRRRGAYHPHE